MMCQRIDVQSIYADLIAFTTGPFTFIQVDVSTVQETIWVSIGCLLITEIVFTKVQWDLAPPQSCRVAHRLAVRKIIYLRRSTLVRLIIAQIISQRVRFSERITRCTTMLCLQTKIFIIWANEFMLLVRILVSKQSLFAVFLARRKLFGNLELSLGNSQMVCRLQ